MTATLLALAYAAGVATGVALARRDLARAVETRKAADKALDEARRVLRAVHGRD